MMPPYARHVTKILPAFPNQIQTDRQLNIKSSRLLINAGL